MIDNDIARIELRLGIILPPEYRQFATSVQQIRGLFSDPQEIIAANERSRKMSWLGRPLASAFYIFGRDESGRELFLDLDLPEPPVMLADHERQRGEVQAGSFGEWISKNEDIG